MGEANDFDVDFEVGSSRSRVIRLTYKRRRNYRISEDRNVLVAGEHLFGAKEGPCLLKVTSGARSFNQPRNIILREICQSLEHDGGLNKCIHDVLAFNPENGTRNVMETSTPCDHGIEVFPSHCNSKIAVEDTLGLPCNRAGFTVTEHCCRAFSDIITSDNFSKLCCLLHENGLKAQKLLDFSNINLKMKENTYESAPLLFQSDIQQVWAQIEKVGKDIVNLASSISDEARASFQEKVAKPVKFISADMSNGVLTEEFNKHEEGRTGSYPSNKLHTCRQCGEKADGRNGLVCDSCEKIYHISCIDPPVKKIPTKSWYCINCTINGIGFPHENCVVCERMSSLRLPCFEEDESMYSKESEEFDKTLNEEVLPNCKVCHNTITNDEDCKACSHSLCPDKFYHVKCLSINELQPHSHCWYCPSCLCRACLVDQDDHKIVLCDGCDHGYHIYCMKPPRDSIPRGRWFCNKCDAEIKCIQKARCSYENMQTRSKGGYSLNKSGGVDMLLNAARTLKHEENPDTMRFKV